MAVDIVLTIVARDRPGLVERVSGIVSAHGGNWIDSSMARLGGEFAGIVRVSLADDKLAAFEADIAGLGDEGIVASVRRADSTPAPVGTRVQLTLTGIDHPGIVYRVAGTLARQQVSIEMLETEVFTGSMSGEQMFSAKATVVLPRGLEIAALRADLERLAQDMMVDIELGGDR